MSKILKANSNSHTELGPATATGMQYSNVVNIFTWKRKLTITFQHGHNMTHDNFFQIFSIFLQQYGTKL